MQICAHAHVCGEQRLTVDVPQMSTVIFETRSPTGSQGSVTAPGQLASKLQGSSSSCSPGADVTGTGHYAWLSFAVGSGAQVQ